MECKKKNTHSHLTGYIQDRCRCVECKKAISEYGKDNRDRLSKHSRRRWRQNKQDLILYRGGRCHCCGLEYDGDNAAVFEFHHPDPSVKDGSAQIPHMSLERGMKEAEKCYLMCANCHRMEHSIKGD